MHSGEDTEGGIEGVWEDPLILKLWAMALEAGRNGWAFIPKKATRGWVSGLGCIANEDELSSESQEFKRRQRSRRAGGYFRV